jgi:hypothetical protein
MSATPASASGIGMVRRVVAAIENGEGIISIS